MNSLNFWFHTNFQTCLGHPPPISYTPDPVFPKGTGRGDKGAGVSFLLAVAGPAMCHPLTPSSHPEVTECTGVKKRRVRQPRQHFKPKDVYWPSLCFGEMAEIKTIF